MPAKKPASVNVYTEIYVAHIISISISISISTSISISSISVSISISIINDDRLGDASKEAG